MPAVRVGERVFVGERCVEDAAGAVGAGPMKALAAYRVLVGRTGWAPAVLAEPERLDHIEVVEIDSGEVVLFWDCRPRDASQLARRLRVRPDELEADEFLEFWSTVESWPVRAS